jgi:hypothetical protein
MFVAALMPTAALAQESKPTPVCVKAEIVPGFEAFGRPAAGPPPARWRSAWRCLCRWNG